MHAELLVNVMPWGPVPNLWVYPRPWYRDAAMMWLCFQRTGNETVMEPWIAGLRSPFDFNNAGEAEADNLGQVLFLAGDRKHPVVEKALKAVKRFERGRHICGRSDFAEHPVYQTKWLKYGLRALGLDDPYEIPAVLDSYSALFWMDYRQHHVPGPRFGADAAAKYPYLTWAEAHFHNEPPPAVDESRAPLTWEAEASQAEYWRVGGERIARPHTWHAAEMFLYLLGQDRSQLSCPSK